MGTMLALALSPCAGGMAAGAVDNTPGAPTGVSVDPSSYTPTGFTVIFYAPYPPPDDYETQVQLTGGDWSTLASDGFGGVVMGLAPETSYEMRVRSVKYGTGGPFYSDWAYGAPVSTLVMPSPSNPPGMAGDLWVGGVWSRTLNGGWNGAPSISLVWFVNGAQVGTGATYTFQPGDVGGTLELGELDSISGQVNYSAPSSTLLSDDTSLSLWTAQTALLLPPADLADGGSVQCGANETNTTIFATPTNGAATRTINNNASAGGIGVGIVAGSNTISVVVTAADGHTQRTYLGYVLATGTVPSNAFTPVLNYSNATIKPVADVDTVHCSPVDSGSGADSIVFRWIVNSVTVLESGNTDYNPVRVDMGGTLQCMVSGVNQWGRGNEVGSNEVQVLGMPVCTVTPVLGSNGINGAAGPAFAGVDRLYVDGTSGGNPATFTGFPDPSGSLAEAWETNGAPNGYDGPQYDVRIDDTAGNVRCLVTADNGVGPPVGAYSNAISVV